MRYFEAVETEISPMVFEIPNRNQISNYNETVSGRELRSKTISAQIGIYNYARPIFSLY